MKSLTDAQKTAILKPIQSALTTTSRIRREGLFDRYMDEPYGDEVKGRSAFRSTDVADVVEAVFAEAMEALASDDNLVEFAPVGPEDEAAAKQETDIVHHLFREQNNSFVTLSTWFKEGLIEQNAYVRSGWVEKTRVLIDEYEDLSMDQFMKVYSDLVSQPHDYDIEVLEGVELGPDGQPMPMAGPDGQPMPIHLRARVVRKQKTYEIEPIPQNEFFVAPKWTKPNLDGCPVCGHKARKSRSELLRMGFSKDSIDKLGDATESSAEINRHSTKDNDDPATNELPTLELFEAYVLADINGDGEDELVQAWTDGDGKTILNWKDGKPAVAEIETIPFSSWTPFIVPHRHVGRSVAELATSIQQLKTVLWRQLLDNLYKTNYPRPEVVEDLATENTYKDLASPDPGKPIRVGGIGAINWQKPPTVLGDVLPLLDRADQDLERHAGATRYAQGLGAEALSQSQIGSEGVGRIMDAAMRRMQVIIRTFAETGLRNLFQLMHADMRRGPNRQLAMKIRNEWVEANPLDWRERTDMTVRIGTGRSDKAMRIAALERVLGEIKEGMASGNPSFTPQHLYETLKRLAKSLGLQSIEPFMMDPSQIPPAPPPEPPVDLAGQAAMAMAQAEQVKAQATMLKAQTDQQKASQELQLKAESLKLDAAIAEAKAREAEALLEIKRIEVMIKEAAAADKIEQANEDRNAAMGVGQ